MSTQQPPQTNYIVPMMIIGALFFIFGFVTWLNGSLIPFLEIICELSKVEALCVTFAFYIAYTVMALPMSVILHKTGYRKGMMIGLLLIAVGALVFIPAAYSRTFTLFLAGLFVMGSGLTILQTASNPYVVKLGPAETAAVRISIMGLLNKAAGIFAPIMFTALILSGMEVFSDESFKLLDASVKDAQLNELAGRLVTPYIIMAAVLAILAWAVMLAPLPDLNDDADENENSENEKFGVLQFPHLVLGAITLFFYVGVEVIAGDTIGSYGKDLGVANFGMLTSYTMAFMVIGYILGTLAIPKLVSQEKALLVSAGLGMLLCFGVISGSSTDQTISAVTLGWLGIPSVPNSVFFLALLGLANALVWPAIWPLALQGLGKYTSTGSALLIMGISGGAILPLAYGYFSEASSSSQGAYWVMIPCYLFILFYALKGHKMTSWTKPKGYVAKLTTP